MSNSQTNKGAESIMKSIHYLLILFSEDQPTDNAIHKACGKKELQCESQQAHLEFRLVIFACLF